MTDTPPTTAPREGSLDAPFRHPIAWRDPDFYDLEKVETEMERVFDICHGCRRCFNLCDSFPRLFDMIDEGPTGELDGVKKADYGKVTEACTLCDMCFMTKCPYVPPHEWAVDFPHLLLRHRAAKRKADGPEVIHEQLAKTDRNGKLAEPVAGLANWASAKGNGFTRPLMEAVLGIDRDAVLPEYYSKTAMDLAKSAPSPDPSGPAFGKKKAVIYATCFAEYNQPATATAALAVLAKQGVDARLVYPKCCGMPQLESGEIAAVAKDAEDIAAEFARWIADGYEVVTLTASCGLMMKFEWPLILPENEAVRTLSSATKDICEYVISLNKAFGLAEGLTPIPGNVTLHHACHARAQNMGAKSAEMLRLIPGTKVDLVERCSGHGGTFGVMKKTHPLAVKVGKPAARQVAQKGNDTLCSDCPLACKHLGELVSADLKEGMSPPTQAHPIEILARAYGLA